MTEYLSPTLVKGGVAVGVGAGVGVGLCANAVVWVAIKEPARDEIRVKQRSK